MKKENSARICVVIPAYNEAGVIKSVAIDAKKIFNMSDYYIDVVVVNDSSTDDTSREARAGGAKVIDHLLNTGAGGATATGLAYARKHDYDAAASMDADGQHNPKDVLKGIKKLLASDTDLLIGNRLKDAEDMPMYKRIGNRGISLLTALLFWTDVTDSQSGLRIFSKRAVRQLEWRSQRYEFCSEMLWRAKQQQLVIADYPIEAIYTKYSTAKGQNSWNSINLLKHLLKSRIVEMFE